jgi:hypothetical protein
MECKTARLLVPFARPRSAELDPEEAEALARHLAECAECRQLHQAEQAIDAQLGQAIRDVPVPEGLRDRLLVGLAEQRRLVLRRRWVRVAGSLAAALLLAVAGWLLWPRPLVPIDLNALSQAANSPPQSAEQVEEAFAQAGIKVRVPTEFDYRLLTHHGRTELEGRLVPSLEFRSGPAFLRVYVLDGKQFNLPHLEQNPEGLSGRVTVKWWGKSSDGKFGYIIEYTGHSLEPFKARDLLPAT